MRVARTSPLLALALALAPGLALWVHASPAHAQRPPRGGSNAPNHGDSGSGSASANDPVAEAHAHFDRGIALFDGGDYGGALAEFNRAYEMSRRPSVLFNISATYQALHRYPEAIATLRRFLDLPESARSPRRTEAEQALRELTALIAHVHVRVDPAGATVTVDGAAVEANADVQIGPGQHQVRAEMEGYRPAREDLQITAGETREVTLQLVPTSQPAVVAPGQTGFVVRGAPPGTTLMVDNQTYSPDDAVLLEPGAHRVTVRAPGMRPWEGDIPLVAGGAHTLRVTLAPVRHGMPPGYGGAAVGLAAVFASGAAITGILALQTHGEFAMRTQSDPEAASLANRGRALSITADALGVATLLSLGLAAYLFSRADFGPTESTVELGVAPLPAGAAVTASGRF